MKTSLVIVLLLVVIVCLYFAFLSITAKSVKAGIVNGKLGPCGSKPNCVNSEFQDGKHIAPISMANLESTQRWDNVKKAVEFTGGTIVEQNNCYLRATYRSSIFRFVDELELRMDTKDNLLHVRSGSRSGTSDFGVNRRRVENLRSKLGPN